MSSLAFLVTELQVSYNTTFYTCAYTASSLWRARLGGNIQMSGRFVSLDSCACRNHSSPVYRLPNGLWLYSEPHQSRPLRVLRLVSCIMKLRRTPNEFECRWSSVRGASQTGLHGMRDEERESRRYLSRLPATTHCTPGCASVCSNADYQDYERLC